LEEAGIDAEKRRKHEENRKIRGTYELPLEPGLIHSEDSELNLLIGQDSSLVRR